MPPTACADVAAGDTCNDCGNNCNDCGNNCNGTPPHARNALRRSGFADCGDT